MRGPYLGVEALECRTWVSGLSPQPNFSALRSLGVPVEDKLSADLLPSGG